MTYRIASACLAGALFALCLAAAPAARAELRVLAPPDEALLAGTPVTILGSGAEAAIEITVTTSKGVETSGGKISGKAFTAEVKLAPGENTILVKSGDQRQRVVYTLAPGDTSARYFRYHPPVAEGDCRACHPQGVGRTSPVSEARLCHHCHELKTGAKVLHGPLGAGQCSICHDPHGSAYPSFLVTGVRALCIQCHAQSRSQKHIEKSGNKQCPECHDPHGSEKQFLLK
jgi:predicted CXXCH cytochrome family protein